MRAAAALLEHQGKIKKKKIAGNKMGTVKQ
jgi:hypothetical protein